MAQRIGRGGRYTARHVRFGTPIRNSVRHVGGFGAPGRNSVRHVGGFGAPRGRVRCAARVRLLGRGRGRPPRRAASGMRGRFGQRRDPLGMTRTASRTLRWSVRSASQLSVAWAVPVPLDASNLSTWRTEISRGAPIATWRAIHRPPRPLRCATSAGSVRHEESRCATWGLVHVDTACLAATWPVSRARGWHRGHPGARQPVRRRLVKGSSWKWPEVGCTVVATR